VPLSLVCTSRFVPLPVCEHSEPGGLLFSQQEAEYSFSGFILTNKQTNREIAGERVVGVWEHTNS